MHVIKNGIDKHIMSHNSFCTMCSLIGSSLVHKHKNGFIMFYIPNITTNYECVTRELTLGFNVLNG